MTGDVIPDRTNWFMTDAIMCSRIVMFLAVGLWVKCPGLVVETVSTSHGNIFSTGVLGILDGRVFSVSY